MSDKDKSLFLEAMQDVQPLASTAKQNNFDSSQNTANRKELIRKVKRRHNSGHDLSLKESSTTHDVDTFPVGSFETISHHQAGLRKKDFDKLKKGGFQIQAELDLHGLTQDIANQKIVEFIEQSYFYELRFIRIIHGKGYNSDEKFPVLKNLVNQLLRQNKAVLAFHSAPVKEGGVGAVNILLKAH